MNPIISSIVYFIIGMLFCALGYKIFDIITPFDLNEEIDNHNIAAGLTVAGIFIGIAIVVSAAIT
jgi:putative membrane protein